MQEMMGAADIAFPNLGLYLNNVPKSFSVFGFEIALYGVFIATGMLCGIYLASRMAVKNGIDSEAMWDFWIYAIVLGVIGARIYYVIFRWDQYKYDPLQIFNLRAGGLAIYGGLIVGFTVLFIFCHVKKIKSLDFADSVVPGIALGQAIGRWGNFTNREVFGEYTDNLLAMRLPVEAVRSSDISESIAAHIAEGTNYIQVHPTFLYEGLWNLALMFFLIWWTRRKKFSGQVMTFYFLGYGIGRFWIEAIRTDVLYIWNTHIAASQLVCVAIVILAIVINVIFLRKKAGSGDGSGTAAESEPDEKT
ncbi:MAG: prolipoprotein diacylglyceryl transferase [Lachnospiraceae bacterium]|nr:prolipoprotein diacylglyceryl transferase [Lachnospiraceae bacterium]